MSIHLFGWFGGFPEHFAKNIGYAAIEAAYPRDSPLAVAAVHRTAAPGFDTFQVCEAGARFESPFTNYQKEAASAQRRGGFFLVRVWGLEPQRLSTREPKSRMSTNSIIPAYVHFTIPHSAPWYKRKLHRVWYYRLCKIWTYDDIQKVV